ncbi:hypothetical protein [Massilia timonae]|uniref:hypothetical protein n=1 Tax=Massilia timonae TaxID=47229 RepID=UPI0028D82030|nr:hypothetical protein [Massilia timonae]
MSVTQVYKSLTLSEDESADLAAILIVRVGRMEEKAREAKTENMAMVWGHRVTVAKALLAKVQAL